MKKLLYISIFIFSNLLFSQTELNYTPILENITIVRDTFGVPHIYGKTDADAAYGLAWANCEDDFGTIQENILSARARLSEVKGKKGVLQDIIGQLIFADEVIDAQYKNLSYDFRLIMKAYTMSLNKYAETHPKEILLKNVFPITEYDLMESYMVGITIISGVGYDLQRIFKNKITNQEFLNNGAGPIASGSNAFAFNSKKTTNGNAFLNINSHQPLEGNYSWYECHVNSDEGWNMMGGTFPGGFSPFIGTNEYLGWAHTVNYPDLCDVYKLTMHPTKKDYYKYDGKWLKLEKHTAKMKVKVGGIKIPVSKTFYRSVYGATLKNKTGYYSIRFPANMTIKFGEQWYGMNKATNFTEFENALRIQGIPVFNVVYADKFDTIYLLCNGHYPYRDPNYQWKYHVLPGDTSATLWEAGNYYPIDSMPKYLNPNAGYLFNTNNTPYNATGPDENLKAENFNHTMGILDKDVNRSIRFQSLIKEYDKVSYLDFKKIKSDIAFQIPLYTRSIENIDQIRHLDENKYPKIADAIAVMKKWNGSATIDNMQCAVFSLSIQYIIKYLNDNGIMDYNNTVSEQVFVDALTHAKKHLLKHFGKLEIPLGDLQKLVRGDKELPLWGLPETICQMYTKPHKKGKLKGHLGDSYIMLVEYTDDGPQIETINAFGSSNKPTSEHYTDQMQMFVNQEYKKMTLNKDLIFKYAEKIYHPQ